MQEVLGGGLGGNSWEHMPKFFGTLSREGFVFQVNIFFCLGSQFIECMC